MNIRFYLFNFFVFLSTAPLFAALQPAASSSTVNTQIISYKDLVNHDSALSRAFAHKPCQECFKMLYDCGTQIDNNSLLCIHDVPTRDGSLTKINVLMQLDNETLTITIHDGDNKWCAAGYMRQTHARLKEIGTKVESSASNLKFAPDETRTTTGTTILRIWDSLWILCNVARCELLDGSEYGIFYLPVLLPYVQGCSWYGKHGYVPQVTRTATYNEAITFLRQRSCTAVMRDFGKNNRITRTIQKCCTLCHLSTHEPFGELIRLLYTDWRYGNGNHFKYLARLYRNCLDEYTAKGKHDDIQDKQGTAAAFFMQKYNPNFSQQDAPIFTSFP